MSLPAWLPATLTEPVLVKLEPLAWAAYQTSFKAGQMMPKFKVSVVSVERNPHVARADREHTYWHAVTEGSPEATRKNAVKERLERVPWLRPFIENWAQCRIWWEFRESSKHWNLWHPSAGHVVIIKETATGYLLKTGYPSDVGDLTRWIKRHEEAKKAGRVKLKTRPKSLFHAWWLCLETINTTNARPSSLRIEGIGW